jgi:hypothetical protein
MDKKKEYSLNKLSELVEDLGQIVKLTTLYNLEQNGTLERLIGIICECTQTVIININIPQFLWPLIFELIILITNQTATFLLKRKTLYKAFTNEFHPN